MMITPQAARVITGAVRAFSPPSLGDEWGIWVQRGPSNEIRTDVTPDIAAIAREALAAALQDIEQRLDAGGLAEDGEADLLNDLGYIRAIETALQP